MCELCGQQHSDMVTVGGLTVCASTRWCLLHMVRTADEASIASMHRRALQQAHRAVQGHTPRRYYPRAPRVGRSAKSLYEVKV